MADRKRSQKSEILDYLKVVGHIDSMTAIERFGATRLSDIIYKLRKDGYNIASRLVQGKNRYGHNTNYSVYTLIKGAESHGA